MTFVRGYWPKVALSEIVSVDDSGPQQVVSHYALAGESHTGVYRPQPHGFSSNPPAGSTGAVVSLGGERSRSILLGAEHDKYRPTGLKEGETKLYDMSGNVIYFANKTGIAVNTKEGDTTIATPNGKMTVSSKGDIKYSSDKGNFFVSANGKIYLGSPDGKQTFAVVTTSGPSSKVFAAL